MSLAGATKILLHADTRPARVVRKIGMDYYLVENTAEPPQGGTGTVRRGNGWECRYCRGKAAAGAYRCGNCGAPR